MRFLIGFVISKCANISVHLDINNCTAVDKEKGICSAQRIEQQLCDEKTTNTEIAVFLCRKLLLFGAERGIMAVGEIAHLPKLFMRCNAMAASYKKLFKLLIDRDMKKKELAEKAGISIATITKMGKDGAVVSSDVLVKICTALECKMDDIVEIVPEVE